MPANVRRPLDCFRLADRPQRRVQRPEALAPQLAVDLDPLRAPARSRSPAARRSPRPPRARRTRPRRRRRRGSPRRTRRPRRPRPAPAAARAPRRRSASHRSLRAPPPDTRPSAGRPAQLDDQVERVAQPEGDALQHRAHQRAAVVAHGQPGERPARVGVGVRRALAGQVGQEQQPLGPGGPRRGRRGQLVVRARRARSCRAASRSEPAADSITPIACHAPGTAWQNACTRPCGSAANRSSAANTTPDVPSTTDTGPGPVDADAERARRLVAARPRRPGCPRRCCPRHRRALEQRRQPRRSRAPERSSTSSLQRAMRRRRAAACRRRRRRRSRARRTGAGARSPWAARSARSARRRSGSWRRSHSSFGAVKPGSARLPVSAISRSSPIVLLDLCALGGRPLVVPQDRRAQHAIVGVERDEPVHLARQADARRRARRAPQLGQHRLGRLPPVGRVLLGPARARRRQRDSRPRRGRAPRRRGRSPGP